MALCVWRSSLQVLECLARKKRVLEQAVWVLTMNFVFLHAKQIITYCFNNTKCCRLLWVSASLRKHSTIDLNTVAGVPLLHQCGHSSVNSALIQTIDHSVIMLLLHFQTVLCVLTVCVTVWSTWACWGETREDWFGWTWLLLRWTLFETNAHSHEWV